MKKLLLAFTLLVFSLTANAQSFSFGPKVGLNISNYTGDDIQSDALVGAHLGGLLNFGIGENFSIQPEVLFSTQGAKIDVAGEKKDYKTSYVTVPVLLRLKSNGGLYLELGPQFGFRTSENIPDQSINHFAKNLDLAAALGVGYQAPFGLGFGARYLAGLSKVGNFDGGSISPDFKNSVLQFSLFYAIPVVR